MQQLTVTEKCRDVREEEGEEQRETVAARMRDKKRSGRRDREIHTWRERDRERKTVCVRERETEKEQETPLWSASDDNNMEQHAQNRNYE